MPYIRTGGLPQLLLGACRRHWLLSLVLVAGVALRVLTWFAYQPALLYIDTFRYLENLVELSPDQLNPIGYSVILSPLLLGVNLSTVAAVQHALGVGIALALYVLALRHGVSRWLAAVVAAVVLLDGYQLQIEQNILSEVWFQALLVGVLWALLGRGQPSAARAALAGVLLGASVLVRLIGGTLLVPMVLYLLLAGITRGGLRQGLGDRARWKRAAKRTTAGVLGFAVVIGLYAGYYRAATGEWGLTGASTRVLYGRMATVADCTELPLSPQLEMFCPDEPVDAREGVDHYAHFVYGHPDWPPELPADANKAQLGNEFGWTVLRNQPLDVAIAVLGDFAKFFTWTKFTWPNDVPIERWQFQTSYPILDPATVETALRYDDVAPTANEDLASFLRGYQLGGGYTPGVLLAVAAACGLAAGAGFGHAQGSGLRSAALLATGSGLIILLGSVAFEFSWRYELPALVLLPLGGAIGVTALRGRGSPPSSAPATARHSRTRSTRRQ
ncbi:MAG TPA: hypothetical protein VK053_18745 [Jiangellaceae bacterium]|nr:hypothetical protein [Jiangellaceae bacterium]